MSTSDIKLAVEALADRRGTYERANAYYQGSQEEVFANSKWKSVFRTNGLDYVLNFTKTVVDSVLDRLEIASIVGTSDEANAAINKIWEQSELELDEREIYKNALVYGECYVIVWPDEDNETAITYNTPKSTLMVYNERDPRKKSFAVNMWQETNVYGKPMIQMQLFFADRVERWTRMGELEIMSGHENSWALSETVENPWGEIPVFHFRTHRPYGTPEHAAAIGAQDAINKLVMNQMTTVDYLGAPQRYALANGDAGGEPEDFEQDDTERENLHSLQGSPGSVWFIKGASQVGQFPAAQSEEFLKPIQAYVRWMASLTSTPLHFFEGVTTLNSGEAVRNIEAPFTKKIRERQRSFGATWRDVFRFVLRVEGIDSDVQVNWAGVETIDSTDAWNIAVIKKGLGIPLDVILKDMGMDKEIADEIAGRADEGKEDTAQLGQGVNTHNLALQQQAEEENN